MAVGAASPAAGHAAQAIGSRDGSGGKATSEVAEKEEPRPAERVPLPGMGRGNGAGPTDGVPAATAVEGEEEEEEEEKWLKDYSSMHSILTVGDGDFSFSLALASKFGSGALMVATSLDTYEVLIGKYRDAESNTTKLKRLETMVLHGIDVKRMKYHTDLTSRRFDRIVFNFPHAGFKGKEDDMHLIKLHKKLLRDFFSNARHLLMPCGEIHVRHKRGGPYERWDLEHLASESSLIMFAKESFQKADYPGYNQKRGDGARCDQAFYLGPSCTFKFQIGDLKKQKKLSGNNAGSTSSLGGSNAPPCNLETYTRPFHSFPLVQAWPWLHFTPPANTVRMPIPLQPYIVAQSQQPGLSLNLDGIVRAPLHQLPSFSIPGPSPNELSVPGSIPLPTCRIAPPNLLALLKQAWYQQGSIGGLPGHGHQQPSFIIPGPLPNELSTPGGIPLPICRTTFPDLLALLKQPWYQQRSIAGLPGHDVFSYFEYQRRLQRECEVSRKAMMPGAAGLSYSSAFLEQQRQDSVQRHGRCLQGQSEVQMKAMIPGAAGLNYSSAFLEQQRRDSVHRHGRCLQGQSEVQMKAMMPGAAGLSYSSAFLEQCNRESVQRSGGTR
ncbi:uncharacterized protein LOC8055837 [Sorghum bicolor]|nr:uncharacterized protein LOC8055837 [Sorghum bicolor]|eukprot:XP_021310116.1 uncharacterized protein LOC8055837 [Sorghum bicolor]